MDVHPPHGGIHSIKDFLIHLLAITIGLLIALGLEGSVEWAHHRRLVGEAKDNLSREITDNQNQLRRELDALPGEETHLKELLHRIGEIRNGHARELGPDYNWSFARLSDAAWNTASATGATGYMAYGEVAGYQRLYFFQQAFNTQMERYVDSRLEMYASMEPSSVGEKPTATELEGAKHAIASQLMTIHVLVEVGNILNTFYGHSSSQHR